MDAVLFYFFGALALASALVVVGQRHPTYSAFALIVTLCSLSAIYGLLGSPFIAVLQIVVYAGAIMVLFLFVLMLLKAEREGSPGDGDERRMLKGVAVALAALLVLEIGLVLTRVDLGPTARSFDASTVSMARKLFSLPYLYAFEATSVLIVAALVGAVALAKKDS